LPRPRRLQVRHHVPGGRLTAGWLASVALSLAIGAGADEAALRPWTRGSTPALAGVDLSGRPLDLRALRGRVVLVQFWASWCEPCRAELPALAGLVARFRGRPFELVTVNLGEGRERAERFLSEARVDLPTLLDRDRVAGRAWGVQGLPMAFLVDAEGAVRSWAFGEVDWSARPASTSLEDLVQEAERRRGKPD
jgi:thiol-disulfide isomerase/thioredoxin